MKTIERIEYQCEKCGEVFNTEDECAACEAQPITRDKGVKIGDKVLIKAGEDVGSYAVVTSITVIGCDWGDHLWRWYWHTIAVTADVIGGGGTRVLTFDEYEVAS